MKIIDTNGTEFTEHTFDDWQKDFEKRHPILNKIDLLFKDTGYAGYAPHHIVTHPWIILEEWGRQIRWAWQRVFQGWDERVIWSIDYHLAEMIPLWMRQLKRDKMGAPFMAYRDEDLQNLGEISKHADELAIMLYDDVLEDIALGFESYIKMDNLINPKLPEYKLEEEKFNKGFDLLKKWFGTFWD
jgi:hypothetical protein